MFCKPRRSEPGSSDVRPAGLPYSASAPGRRFGFRLRDRPTSCAARSAARSARSLVRRTAPVSPALPRAIARTGPHAPTPESSNRSSATGPSGLADPPRPFVFRVSQLAGRAIAPGEEFCFDVNFFDTRHPALDDFARAFTELARADAVSTSSAPVSIRLDPDRAGANRLRVEFLTPTELKSAPTPDFAALFARARDRVSTSARALWPRTAGYRFPRPGRARPRDKNDAL